MLAATNGCCASPRVGSHLSALRVRGGGIDAGRRMHLPLRMYAMSHRASAEERRLLRLLFIWFSEMPVRPTTWGFFVNANDSATPQRDVACTGSYHEHKEGT